MGEGRCLNDLELEIARNLATCYRRPHGMEVEEALDEDLHDEESGESFPTGSFGARTEIQRQRRHGYDQDEDHEDQDEEGLSDDEVCGKSKCMSVEDRKARNRERNRLHARKTRQRKKQHVQELQLRIWELRQERQHLIQLATEHRTAGVLLTLSGSPPASPDNRNSTNPTDIAQFKPAPKQRDWDRELAFHHRALRKITQQFESMDGNQLSGEERGVGAGRAGPCPRSKARSGKGQCVADRTELRRERNRMHAKRTRNRKKLFVEACSVIIDKMVVENERLQTETQAMGVYIPQKLPHCSTQNSLPSEPLPEYLAALWDFAEGRTPGTTPRTGRSKRSRSPSPLSEQALIGAPIVPVAPVLGQEMEDAEALCSFMETAQGRAAKRSCHSAQEKMIHMYHSQRQWSDHGSTTSECRGSSDDEETSDRGDSKYNSPMYWVHGTGENWPS